MDWHTPRFYQYPPYLPYLFIDLDKPEIIRGPVYNRIKTRIIKARHISPRPSAGGLFNLTLASKPDSNGFIRRHTHTLKLHRLIGETLAFIETETKSGRKPILYTLNQIYKAKPINLPLHPITYNTNNPQPIPIVPPHQTHPCLLYTSPSPRDS